MVNQEFVYNLVAGHITAGDLAAGDLILTDGMRIVSNNPNGGNVLFNGSTLQFLDSSGNVGIQIGYNTEDQSGNLEYPHIVIRDSSGSTLITSTGITQNAVPDNLIVNRMLANQSVSQNKLDFQVLTPNAQGGIDITSVYDGSGNLWGTQYTSFKTLTEESLGNIGDDIDDLEQDVSDLQTALNNLSGLAESVELTGQNTFSVASDGTISPASIQIFATAKNGLVIDKWYIDGVQNTSYVSQDNTTITIPSTFMADKQQILIRVVGTDTTKFDTISVFKVSSGVSIASDVMEYCTYSSST